MIAEKSAPKSGENVWLWLIKIVSGVLIVVILGIHFAVNHFIGQSGLLTWSDVVAYYSHPIVPLMEMAFIILVVPHSLIGLRGILLDLRPSRGVLTVINWLFSVVGIVAVVYGIWLIQVLASQSTAR